MIKQFFSVDLYIRIYANKYIIRDITNPAAPEQTFESPDAFTTERLLVGRFSVGESVLKNAIKVFCSKKWLTPSPRVLIQPMEMTEGGLSEVEDRLFRELALGAGARKVVIWVGKELSVIEAQEKLDTKG